MPINTDIQNVPFLLDVKKDRQDENTDAYSAAIQNGQAFISNYSNKDGDTKQIIEELQLKSTYEETGSVRK
jgi:hypothetical protein